MRRRLHSILAACSFLLLVATAAMWMRGVWFLDTFGYTSHGQWWSTQFGAGCCAISKTLGIISPAAPQGFIYSSISREMLTGTGATALSSSSGLTMSGTETHTYYGVTEISAPVSHYFGFFGIHYSSSEWPASGYSSATVGFPYWLILVLFAVIPAWWAAACLRKRQIEDRKRLGLCSACGYDLRVSPQRCPECGREVQATQA